MPSSHADQECILVLQGGGALGAYQAGVFEALSTVYREPTWVAGISIGAINAALITGNPANTRVARLREFWQLLSSSFQPPALSSQGNDRQAVNEASATQVMLMGVPGFFAPRFPPAPFQPRGTLAAISYYDTAPLRQTLERLVDFDRINSGAVRLSVGAVNVRSGNFEYFDSARQRIDARHIMASGAPNPRLNLYCRNSFQQGRGIRQPEAGSQPNTHDYRAIRLLQNSGPYRLCANDGHSRVPCGSFRDLAHSFAMSFATNPWFGCTASQREPSRSRDPIHSAGYSLTDCNCG